MRRKKKVLEVCAQFWGESIKVKKAVQLMSVFRNDMTQYLINRYKLERAD